MNWVLLLACTQSPQEHESHPVESHDGPENDSIPDPPDSDDKPTYEWNCDRQMSGLPWEDPDFWTEPGPLAELILPSTIPSDPHWELRRASSSDRWHWTADPTVYAIHLSSLSLLSVNEGLILMVSLDAVAAGGLDVNAGGSRETTVIATQDLVHWSSQTYRLMEEEQMLLTDPSWWLDENQILHGLWYQQPWDSQGVPAGNHPLATAVWKDGCFEAQQVVYEADGLLDPVICKHPARGDWWLFATSPGLLVTGAMGENPGAFTEAFQTERGSVPFCYPDGSELRILSQTPDGLQPVISATVTADGIYQEAGPLYDTAPFPNCTSPVIAKWGEDWSLFCAVWVG